MRYHDYGMLCQQLHVLGGAALSMTGSDAHLKTAAVFGDNSGRVTVRRNQTYNVTEEARVLLPHALLAQRHSTVNLPPKLTCRSLDVILKGENIQVQHFAFCQAMSPVSSSHYSIFYQIAMNP